MDFDAITDFWFGEVKTPEFPLEPLNLGGGFSDERIEFRDPERVEFINPFEPLPEASRETPEPEEEEQDGN